MNLGGKKKMNLIANLQIMHKWSRSPPRREDRARVPGRNVHWRLRDDHGESRIRSACFGAINNAGRAPPRRATLFLRAPAGVLGRAGTRWLTFAITRVAAPREFPRIRKNNTPPICFHRFFCLIRHFDRARDLGYSSNCRSVEEVISGSLFR